MLEALKEDLGVRTSRSEFLLGISENLTFSFPISIEPDTYASIHKATSYDNDPLPPPTTREDLSVRTPKTPHDERRRSSYDINAPLPWQSDNNSDRSTTHEIQRSNLTNHTPYPLSDDHLFSPISKPIQPKPRLSLQTKTDDHHQADDLPNTSIERELTPPMDFNSTVRKPMNDLMNTDWLSDAQPAKTTTTTTTIQKSPLPHVREQQFEEEQEEANHGEYRSPSPQVHNRPESSAYASDNFEENYDSDT